MAFNPYEILANLRKNSNREPLKSFELDKSTEGSVSGWKSNHLKNNSIIDDDSDKNKHSQFLNALPIHYPDKKFDLTLGSVNRNLPFESKERLNTFDQEAAIRSYKNQLLQEMPELLNRDVMKQESSWWQERNSQNLSLYDIKGNIEGRGSEALEFENKRNSKVNQAYEFMNERKSDVSGNELKGRDNKKISGEGTEYKEVVRIRTDKSSMGNKEKKTGSFWLAPFIHLKENYPQFPQSIIKIDLKELDDF